MEFDGGLYKDCSVDDIKRGYIEGKEGYTCILCGEYFIKGEIYTFNGKLYEAVKAVQIHIKEEHTSVKKFLLSMKANTLGISDLQMQLLNFFASGLSDKEIADYLGVSGSTIRNHRFKLREKEKQSRLFLAAMELIASDEDNAANLPINLEGYKINYWAKQGLTDREKKKILDKYFTPEGRIKAYPTYERSKRVILEKILEHFCIGRKYTEEEINEALSIIYKDYRLLKEELISYNYLGRSNMGGIYWVKDYKKMA